MAQNIFRPKEARTFLGTESTFGTTPSMTNAFPINGTFSFALDTKQIENEDESAALYDQKDLIHGMQEGSCKFEYALRPHGTQLNSGSAPSTHPLSILLGGILGGRIATSGSAIGPAATTGSVPVTAGQGSRFTAGQWALFTVNGALEPGRITAVSTDTLTVFPALSAAPTLSGAVINMENYYPTENNSTSITVQHAKAQNSAAQYTFNGCTGDLELKLDRNEILKAGFSLKAASFVTGSQGLSTSVATDSMAAPMVLKNATVILQPITDGTRTSTKVVSVSVKPVSGMELLEELGGIEGKSQAFRTGQRLFSEATVKLRYDSDFFAYWQNQTKLQFAVLVPAGAGTSKRWNVVDMPTCVIKGEPKIDNSGAVSMVEITLVSKLNQLVASSTNPFVLAMG